MTLDVDLLILMVSNEVSCEFLPKKSKIFAIHLTGYNLITNKTEHFDFTSEHVMWIATCLK